MCKKLKSAVPLLLCLSLLCEAQGQEAESSPAITVRRLEAVKLVDEKRQPRGIDARISLQAGGKAISELQVFYRGSADSPFQEVPCQMLPNLKYYARLDYIPLIEYYLVAIPFVGSPIKFGQGRIIGSDLEPHRRTPFWGPATYYGASAATIIALVTSVLVHSDEPGGQAQPSTPSSARAAGAPSTVRNRASLHVGIAALAGGVTASVAYLRHRHKKLEERIGHDPSERPPNGKQGGWPTFRRRCPCADIIPAQGAPSFRVFCERVGGTDLNFRGAKCIGPRFPPL